VGIAFGAGPALHSRHHLAACRRRRSSRACTRHPPLRPPALVPAPDYRATPRQSPGRRVGLAV